MHLDKSQRASREQFDRQSDRYGRSHILADTSDLDWTVAGIDLAVGGRALDVATGGGHTALWLARRGYQVAISDIAPRMIEQASRLLRESGMPVDSRLHTAEALPYADSTFAVVTSRVAPHHFSDPRAFVREAARVLAAGGHLLVVDGTAPDDMPTVEAWTHEVERLRDPSHGRFIRPREWRALSEDAGLTVLKCDVSRFKQPDLEWHFETAATPPGNRERVRELVRTATPDVREYFRLGEEDGKTVWQWPRVHVVARKPEGA